MHERPPTERHMHERMPSERHISDRESGGDRPPNDRPPRDRTSVIRGEEDWGGDNPANNNRPNKFQHPPRHYPDKGRREFERNEGSYAPQNMDHQKYKYHQGNHGGAHQRYHSRGDHRSARTFPESDNALNKESEDQKQENPGSINPSEDVSDIPTVFFKRDHDSTNSEDEDLPDFPGTSRYEKSVPKLPTTNRPLPHAYHQRTPEFDDGRNTPKSAIEKTPVKTPIVIPTPTTTPTPPSNLPPPRHVVDSDWGEQSNAPPSNSRNFPIVHNINHSPVLPKEQLEQEQTNNNNNNNKRERRQPEEHKTGRDRALIRPWRGGNTDEVHSTKSKPADLLLPSGCVMEHKLINNVTIDVCLHQGFGIRFYTIHQLHAYLSNFKNEKVFEKVH